MAAPGYANTDRPPRFRLRAEAAGWRPVPAGRSAAFPPSLPAGAGCWIPAARLVSLRVRAGASACCLLVLERREGAWADAERQMVSATAGELRGADVGVASTVSFGEAEISGPCLLLPLSVAVSPDAAPGRYKGPMEVRCGRRIEPLALLIEVERA